MSTRTSFADRTAAGAALADAVQRFNDEDPIVMGLPRGGLPVAQLVAEALAAPLDVVVVRKVGAPGHREYAVGAVGDGGVEVLDRDAMAQVGVGRDAVEAIIQQERDELERRVERYRRRGAGQDVAGRTVIVVDDGIATGRTARAAAQVLRARGAGRVVLAVPVAAPLALPSLEKVYDEVLVLHAPESFMAVGSWYEDFAEVTDEDVERILALQRGGTASHEPAGTPVAREVTIPVDGDGLPGELVVPDAAIGLVVFAHGSGSSRHSRRNQQVAVALQEAGLATLLLDLLTEAEGTNRRNVFNIELLARRVTVAVDWAQQTPVVAGMPIGLFGASTGAAAALEAAAGRTETVRAVVSRGGRVDLSERADRVLAPVLMVVGGNDDAVLDMNRDTAARLSVEHRVEVVDGAGHLFAGPGQLQRVAELAGDWFRRHLGTNTR